VEGAETPLAALRRELGEELGIEIEGAREVGRDRHLYPDGTDVALIFFHVTAYRGAIANRVFEKLRWVSVQDLDGMDFLEGDRPLIEKLVRGDLRLRV
jgi:8-oxo-dGTP diphosphatase